MAHLIIKNLKIKVTLNRLIKKYQQFFFQKYHTYWFFQALYKYPTHYIISPETHVSSRFANDPSTRNSLASQFSLHISETLTIPSRVRRISEASSSLHLFILRTLRISNTRGTNRSVGASSREPRSWYE